MVREQFNEIVWKRFIRMPYGHLLDYADANGQTTIPTPHECQTSNPNPLGWWTPIENGAFFGGIYLYALLEQYAKEPDLLLRSQIETIKNGLFLLQDVSQTDGFIARGVATDGVSHYPCSSEDQVAPWILGLYRYYQSDLCTDKEQVKGRLLRTLYGIRDNNWSIPLEAPYTDVTNRWLQATDWRGVCKMLFCARVIYELSGDQADLLLYSALCDGRPDKCVFTRAQIASHGFSHDMVRNTGLIQFWIDVCAHLGLRYLSYADTDREALFRQGCVSNGVTTLQFIEDIGEYDNIANGFSLNWRRIQSAYRLFDGTLASGVQIASDEAAIWGKEVVPHRHMEHTVLGRALFGAWIALNCRSAEIEQAAAQRLPNLLDGVQWDSLTLSYAFVAEGCLIFS